jgi:histidinol-phosphatase (PHP family)
VHLLQNRDPYYKYAFEGLTDTQAYRLYFETYLENIKIFHDFDALGHLDYVVRYGRDKEKSYRCADYWDVLDEILKNLVEYDKALEINAAGYRKNLGFPNPHGDIIKRFKELGGDKVTVGCDAHKPSHIGWGLKQAEDLLLDCGFRYYTQYKQRRPEFVKI